MMGGGDDKKKQQQPAGTGFGTAQGGSTPGSPMSGDDPRGNAQNQIRYNQTRYESQQGPLAAATMYNYGRSSEAQYGDYTDLMNNYRDIYSGGGSSGGGGGGGGGYDPGEVFDASGMYTPFLAGYKDPFESYAGYKDFSTTGGYSADDITNMRARGVAPIRAAYANAQSEIGRQRALQGGYSPNTTAALARMAREQGQSAADVTQNVEAGLAQARIQGKLAGLGGMSNIEGQRLNADVDISKFNAGQQTGAQVRNISAAQQAAQERASNARAASAAAAAASAASMNDRFRALAGASSLYSATPGQAQLFGNQAIQSVGQGGQMGMGYINAQIAAGQLPGAWEQANKRINSVIDYTGKAGNALAPWLDRNPNGGIRGTDGRQGNYEWQGPQDQYTPQGPQMPPDYNPNPYDWSQQQSDYDPYSMPGYSEGLPPPDYGPEDYYY